ncbi:MAG TPA: aldehyde ferredoxin oxidoreductase family protein [Firmicutes bacterium]|nr:aldehyde ferredoxin oxidoreductase family protein [Bacillota bacterium]
MKGYNGRLLRIDLSQHKIWEEDLDLGLARKFVGGRGLGVAILFRELDNGIDPFSPQNKLVFAVGPFEGPPIPGGSRLVITGKSPLTGLLGDSDLGGYFPLEMKRAGYDAIIVEGKSDRPVYLWVKDGCAELRDAGVLWGRTTFEAQNAIIGELGDDKVKVVTIGPAGENLVRYACIAGEVRYFAGRSGLGAVMGSKNLKAIAVRGTGKIDIADPEGLSRLVRELNHAIRTDGSCDSLAKYGTWNSTAPANLNGIIPTKNFRFTTFDKTSEIDGDAMLRTIYAGHRTCPWCPVACRRVVKSDGQYPASPDLGGPQYETVAAFGSLLLNSDPRVIARANELCNLYGLDTISAGVSIAFAMECYERGTLSRQELGGDLKWGDPGGIFRMLEDITYRRGAGDVLAEGVMRASKAIGKGSEEWAMHVKGMELPMHDPRGKKGQAISYATSMKGADHMESMHDEAFQRESALPQLGFAVPMSRKDFQGKPRLVKTMQDYWGAMADSLTVCKLLMIPPRPFSPQRVVDALNYVTGWGIDLEEFVRIGERIYNLGRVFLARELRREPGSGKGASLRHLDALPARFSEPLASGGSQGERISPEDLDRALNEYYELRGWNPGGIPTASKLQELELQDIVGEIAP